MKESLLTKEPILDVKTCSQCILDSNDTVFIDFDEEGVCNYCNSYKEIEHQYVFEGERGRVFIQQLVEKIKQREKNKPYDCIIGVSGGVDSTYLALKLVELGLKPLAVHLDNGWNSELAVHNIENICKLLDIDLYTYVIDWREFRDIQRSFFKASVVDIEAITDHSFPPILYGQAAKHGLKYIMSGNNYVTEVILPKGWIYKDYTNIRAIQKQFGTMPIRKYPMMNRKKRFYYEKIRGIKTVELLNYMPYNKMEAKAEIIEKLGWRDYGGKHYESIFTRFYQGYILPTKFGIDKRKAHYSNLICSGQISREEALEEMKLPAYDEEQYKVDREFVLKKLGFSEAEFGAMMAEEPISHKAYPYTRSIYEQYPGLSFMKPFTNRIKKHIF